MQVETSCSFWHALLTKPGDRSQCTKQDTGHNSACRQFGYHLSLLELLHLAVIQRRTELGNVTVSVWNH
jgi:hypothetical protein